MYREKRQLIRIPKLKMTKTRGPLAYQFLRIVDKESFRKVSEIRKEFKPVVIDDKEKRARASPRLWDSFQKLRSTSAREEKLFDTEYCAIRDFLEAFGFVAPLGPRNDEEITLTYFGSELLKLCEKSSSVSIFEPPMKPFRARVYLFTDNTLGWNFVRIIRENGPLAFDVFCDTLLQRGIGLDHEKIKRDIAAKPKFRQKLIEEWRELHKLAPMDYKWKERKIEERAKAEARENVYVKALLNVYIESGLISRNNNMLRANVQYIKKIQEGKFWKTSEDIDHSIFFQQMYDVYMETIKSRSVMSVPIPELRKATCLRVGMPWASFDKLLKEFPSGYKDYEIILTRGSSAKRLDLSINSKHFYYIQFRRG